MRVFPRPVGITTKVLLFFAVSRIVDWYCLGLIEIMSDMDGVEMRGLNSFRGFEDLFRSIRQRQ